MTEIDFIKYKTLLKKVLPNSSDNQLEEYFNIRCDFWECIVDNIDRIDFDKKVIKKSKKSSNYLL
jgi:hypothetical protein